MIYTYDTVDGRFVSNFLPANAMNVITYDMSDFICMGSIFSSATSGNYVAKMVIWCWDNPERMDAIRID